MPFPPQAAFNHEQQKQLRENPPCCVFYLRFSVSKDPLKSHAQIMSLAMIFSSTLSLGDRVSIYFTELEVFFKNERG